MARRTLYYVCLHPFTKLQLRSIQEAAYISVSDLGRVLWISPAPSFLTLVDQSMLYIWDLVRVFCEHTASILAPALLLVTSISNVEDSLRAEKAADHLLRNGMSSHDWKPLRLLQPDMHAGSDSISLLKSIILKVLQNRLNFYWEDTLGL